MASEAAKKLADEILRHRYGDEAVAQIDAAVAPLVRLIERYADHHISCMFFTSDGSYPCDCGFNELYKDIKNWSE